MSDEWDERDSALYRRLADAAVPRRVEQIATLLTLLPPSREGSHVVEIGCGPGALSYAVLEAFPRSRVTALDGSKSMLAHAAERLARFEDRARLRRFRLSSSDWLEALDVADAVVSSLCLHHLDDGAKKDLFGEVHDRLSPRGALLVADLVAPRCPGAEEVFREAWDGYARSPDRALWELFETEQWNVYRHPDPTDKPSGLFQQLSWLSEVGFATVDVFWMDAGHAIFGGYRPARVEGPGITYPRALEVARRAVDRTR